MCGIEKPVAEFSKYKSGNPFCNCKKCEHLLDKKRPGYYACKKRSKLQQKPKRKIHKRIYDLIKFGSIKRCPCVLCGSEINIEAHHNDYAKPLEITWLCRNHHQWLHKVLFKYEYKKLDLRG